MSNSEPWYSAKAIYLWVGEQLYEERITLHRAIDFDDAWKKHEKESHDYIQSQNDIGTKLEFIKTIEVYHCFEEKITSGYEVYSSLRKSRLAAKDYVSQMYEDGMEWRSA